MTDRHVWLAIPCYTGTIHLGTMRSIIHDVLHLGSEGIKVTILDDTGNSMIAHSRNLIAAKFLGSDATDLVFIDHDVTWPSGQLYRLCQHPVDVVAAAYPFKSDQLNFPVSWLKDPEEKGLWANPDTGLIEVAGVAAGFLRLTRACLEKMSREYKHKRFADANAPGGFGWALFDNIHEGDVYYGEDYSFCRRWRDIGGQVWVDPTVPMGHIGYKTFAGCLGEWLMSRDATI